MKCSGQAASGMKKGDTIFKSQEKHSSGDYTIYPDLADDEKLVTTSPSVRVKSHFFDLFLTQKRLILTQPDYPDAPQVDIVFTTVHEFSRGETAEGDPSLFLTVTSGGNERKMVLVFDGGGGFKPADERDRVAELVGGMLAEVAAPPAAPARPPPDTADAGDSGAPSSPGSAKIVGPVPEAPQPPSAPISGLKADHIIVKGHEFIASLTPETISLIRHEDKKAPPLTVRRTDITDVVAKESAGGDPSLYLRVRAKTGDERTMVLIFSEWYSGGRAAERDEWARALTETCSVSLTPRPSARTPPSPPGPSVTPLAPHGTMFCTDCGAPLAGGPRFCPNCGIPVVSDGLSPAKTSRGIRDLPFDAAAEDEPAAKKQRTRQKREKPVKRQREPRTGRKASFRFRSQEMGLSEVPFVEKYLGFLFAPDDAFRYTKTDSFGQAMVYLAALLAIFSAVTSVVLYLFAGSLDAAEYPQMAALGADIMEAIFLIPELVILGIVGIVIWSVVMHIVLRLARQSDDVTETFRTCAYAATPFGTVGLIPFFGPPAAALWMLFLQYKGLVTADDVEDRFAMLAVAVPVILCVAIFSIFLSAGGSQ
jgi:hypothetical protein